MRAARASSPGGPTVCSASNLLLTGAPRPEVHPGMFLALGQGALKGVLASQGPLCRIDECTRDGTKAQKQRRGAALSLPLPWLDQMNSKPPFVLKNSA